ncbi:MAG: ABC transporter ATP-binding protein [Candidatus Hydrogenedentota bacterium]|nr:MAG: ABC transporter ATP-binding protein [Candidatus Hydrogenedentota bacterium]
MSEVAVSIRGLKKSFGTRTILDGIDLDIYRGEIMYIIGKSGSGKSVTLKHITALLRPDEGEVRIHGKNIFEMDDKELIEVRKKMGVLFQMAALFDSLTVFENVAFLLRRFTKDDEDTITKKVRERLRLVGLSHVEHLKPADLSGGMQKRVGLARAIALNPEIVLYDEPTTGVDPILAAAVDDLILKLNHELGVTSIVISHDMESVFRVADRVAMLYDGQFRLIGTPDDFRNSQDPVIRQFVEGSAKGPIPIL